MDHSRILAWLPSPMGDVIMCTPALQALRRHFPEAVIAYCASPMARAVLEPCDLTDGWLTPGSAWQTLRRLRAERFSLAILFKGSFGSALCARLAGIPQRVGYARDARAFLLTRPLQAPRLPNGRFAPRPMVDYYLTLVAVLGAEAEAGPPRLAVDDGARLVLESLYPTLTQWTGPLVIMVPGSAFGPSKCWPAESFARVAETLTRDAGAHVCLSVAPNDAERRIAGRIVELCHQPVTNLGDRPLSLGQLKALFARADLVISNDTGPRHIAIALGRKVISLFGPNDPAWTQTGHPGEIQLVGSGPCVPCQRPTCAHPEVACMESITVERVCDAARDLLR